MWDHTERSWTVANHFVRVDHFEQDHELVLDWPGFANEHLYGRDVHRTRMDFIAHIGDGQHGHHTAHRLHAQHDHHDDVVVRELAPLGSHQAGAEDHIHGQIGDQEDEEEPVPDLIAHQNVVDHARVPLNVGVHSQSYSLMMNEEAEVTGPIPFVNGFNVLVHGLKAQSKGYGQHYDGDDQQEGRLVDDPRQIVLHGVLQHQC